jgi:hypothetical protein
VPITEADFRFTTANNDVYAFIYIYPEAAIRSLSTSAAKVERVPLLGPQPRQLQFRQSTEALIVTLSPTRNRLPCPTSCASKEPNPSAPCSSYPPN